MIMLIKMFSSENINKNALNYLVTGPSEGFVRWGSSSIMTITRA